MCKSPPRGTGELGAYARRAPNARAGSLLVAPKECCKALEGGELARKPGHPGGGGGANDV